MNYADLVEKYILSQPSPSEEKYNYADLVEKYLEEERRLKAPPPTSAAYWKGIFEKLANPNYVASSTLFPIGMARDVALTAYSVIKPSYRGGWEGTAKGIAQMAYGFIKPFVEPFSSFYEDPIGTAIMWYFGGHAIKRGYRALKYRSIKKQLEAEKERLGISETGEPGLLVPKYGVTSPPRYPSWVGKKGVRVERGRWWEERVDKAEALRIANRLHDFLRNKPDATPKEFAEFITRQGIKFPATAVEDLRRMFGSEFVNELAMRNGIAPLPILPEAFREYWNKPVELYVAPIDPQSVTATPIDITRAPESYALPEEFVFKPFEEVKPKSKVALYSYRAWPQKGSKLQLLSHKDGLYAKLLYYAALDSDLIVDVFGGTGLIGNYLSGVLDKPIKRIYNDVNPWRADFIDMVAKDPGTLKQQIEKHINAVDKIVEKHFDPQNPVASAKLVRKKLNEYFSRMDEPGKYYVAQFMNKLSNAIDPVDPNDLTKAKPDISVYYDAKAGKLRIGAHAHLFKGKWREHIDKLHEVTSKHPLEVTSVDGWELVRQTAGPRVLLPLDPTYIAEAGRKVTTYGKNILETMEEDRTFEGFMKHFREYIDPALKKGAKVIITNTWDDRFIPELEKRGLHYAKVSRKTSTFGRVREADEIVIWNFDLDELIRKYEGKKAGAVGGGRNIRRAAEAPAEEAAGGVGGQPAGGPGEAEGVRIRGEQGGAEGGRRPGVAGEHREFPGRIYLKPEKGKKFKVVGEIVGETDDKLIVRTLKTEREVEVPKRFIQGIKEIGEEERYKRYPPKALPEGVIPLGGAVGETPPETPPRPPVTPEIPTIPIPPEEWAKMRSAAKPPELPPEISGEIRSEAVTEVTPEVRLAETLEKFREEMAGKEHTPEMEQRVEEAKQWVKDYLADRYPELTDEAREYIASNFIANDVLLSRREISPPLIEGGIYNLVRSLEALEEQGRSPLERPMRRPELTIENLPEIIARRKELKNMPLSEHKLKRGTKGEIIDVTADEMNELWRQMQEIMIEEVRKRNPDWPDEKVEKVGQMAALNLDNYGEASPEVVNSAVENAELMYGAIEKHRLPEEETALPTEEAPPSEETKEEAETHYKDLERREMVVKTDEMDMPRYNVGDHIALLPRKEFLKRIKEVAKEIKEKNISFGEFSDYLKQKGIKISATPQIYKKLKEGKGSYKVSPSYDALEMPFMLEPFETPVKIKKKGVLEALKPIVDRNDERLAYIFETGKEGGIFATNRWELVGIEKKIKGNYKIDPVTKERTPVDPDTILPFKETIERYVGNILHSYGEQDLASLHGKVRTLVDIKKNFAGDLAPHALFEVEGRYAAFDPVLLDKLLTTLRSLGIDKAEILLSTGDATLVIRSVGDGPKVYGILRPMRAFKDVEYSANMVVMSGGVPPELMPRATREIIGVKIPKGLSSAEYRELGSILKELADAPEERRGNIVNQMSEHQKNLLLRAIGVSKRDAGIYSRRPFSSWDLKAQETLKGIPPEQLMRLSNEALSKEKRSVQTPKTPKGLERAVKEAAEVYDEAAAVKHLEMEADPKILNKKVKQFDDLPVESAVEVRDLYYDPKTRRVVSMRLPLSIKESLPEETAKRISEYKKRLRGLRNIAEEVGYGGYNALALQRYFGGLHPDDIMAYCNALVDVAEGEKIIPSARPFREEFLPRIEQAVERLRKAYERNPQTREVVKRLWGRHFVLEKKVGKLPKGTELKFQGAYPGEFGFVKVLAETPEGKTVEIEVNGSELKVITPRGKLPLKPVFGLLIAGTLLPELLEAAQDDDNFSSSYVWKALLLGGSFFVLGPALWNFFKKYQAEKLIPENIKVRKGPPSKAYRAAVDGVRGKFTVRFRDFLTPVETLLMDWEHKTGIPLWSKMYVPLMTQAKVAAYEEARLTKMLDDVFKNERFNKALRVKLYEYRKLGEEALRGFPQAEKVKRISAELDKLNEYFAKYFDIDRQIEGYTPLRYPQDVLHAVMTAEPKPGPIKMWQELVRKGAVTIPEEDVYLLYRQYIRSGVRAKFMADFYDMARDMIKQLDARVTELSGSKFQEEYAKWAKKLGVEAEAEFPKGTFAERRSYIREFLEDWLEHDILLRPDAGDTMLLSAITKAVNTVRKMTGRMPTFTESEALHWLNTLLSVTYSAGIGAPSSYIKNFTQAFVLGLPFVGPKAFWRGLKLLATKEGREIFAKSAVKIDLPFERESATIGAALGRADRVIQGVAYGLMYPFDKMDTFNRSVVYLGVWDVAKEAIQKFRDGKIGEERLARMVKLKRYHPVVRRRFWEYLKDGLDSNAAHLLADQAQARTQFRYFQGNMPRIFRRLGIFRGRVMGRFMGQFGTWQLWFADFLRRAVQNKQYDALAGVVGASVALSWLANRMGFNINDWFLAGPFTPVRGPIPFAAGPVPAAVTGAGSAAIAWIRQMQGDPYAARMKADAWWQVKQSALMFVPGGRLIKSVKRAIEAEEQPATVRLALSLGFSPKRIAAYEPPKRSKGLTTLTVEGFMRNLAQRR